MSLNTTMLSNPEAIIISPDDGEIKQLIVDLGFSGPPPNTGKPEWTAFMGVTTHPTHWISIAYHSNYPKPSDNGYNMVALPKQFLSEAQATVQFEVMMRSQFRSGHLPTPTWIDGNPRYN